MPMSVIKVRIRQLKEFALNHLEIDDPLRDLLLSEDDELEANVLIIKMDVWLKLLSRSRMYD